jgi:hypothetical protein
MDDDPENSTSKGFWGERFFENVTGADLVMKEAQ